MQAINLKLMTDMLQKNIAWICHIYTKTGIGETREMMFTISLLKTPFYKTLTKYNQVQQ
jgi:hypothetical protein